MKKLICALLATLSLASPVCLAAEDAGVLGAVGVSLTPLDESFPGSAECDLGDYVADAVRQSLGTDLAIVNSGDLARDFPANVVSYGEIRALFTEDRELAVVTVTPKRLCEILESCLAYITVNPETERIDREASAFGGFPQLSGLKLQYDGSARPGERVYSMKLSNGKTLDPDDDETRLTLAATAYMLEGGWTEEVVDGAVSVGKTLSEAVSEYIEAGDIELEKGRITAIGVNDNFFAERFSPVGVAVCALVTAAFFLALGTRYKDIKFNIYVPRPEKSSVYKSKKMRRL